MNEKPCPTSARLQRAVNVELATLRCYPRDKDVRMEIAHQLFLHCADDAHIDRAVDRLLEHDYWPGPGGLRRAAREASHTATRQQAEEQVQ